MRSLAVTTGDDGNAFRFEDVPKPVPGAGQVLVRMRAASLNFRDLLLRDWFKAGTHGDTPWPPFSDGCGIIEALGDGVVGLSEGQRVVTLFFQTWDGGEATKRRLGASLGGPVPGIAADYVVLDAVGVAPVPDHLSDVEAATLPCAALTAWHALIESTTIRPGGSVLLIGTGGVSVFALQFAVAAGLRTIVTSSSEAKLARCRELGADVTINYRETPEWHREVRRATKGVGADLVIEVGGTETIERSLKSTRVGGEITLVGGVSGYQLAVDVMWLITNAVSMRGINVGSRDMYLRMAAFIAQHRIVPVIEKTYGWTDVNTAMRSLREGRHFGKIALTFD